MHRHTENVSENHCWSGDRSTSIIIRQNRKSKSWSMSWFCSWSMFRSCALHWTKRHSFSFHWKRSEQTA